MGSDINTAVIMVPKENDDQAVHSIMAIIDIFSHTINLCIDSKFHTAKSSDIFTNDEWSGGDDAGFGMFYGAIAMGGVETQWKGSAAGSLKITKCSNDDCSDLSTCSASPTPAPTAAPTHPPTPAPTAAPTHPPTPAPTPTQWSSILKCDGNWKTQDEDEDFKSLRICFEINGKHECVPISCDSGSIEIEVQK